MLSGQGNCTIVGQENGGAVDGVSCPVWAGIGFTEQGLQGLGGRLVKLIN